MRPTLKCTVLAIALLLTGCGREVEQKQDGWTVVSTDGGAGGVKEVTLPSGRQCVVLVGYNKGAISCDWR